MKNKMTQVFCLFVAIFATSLYGEAGPYNCQSQAVEKNVSDVAENLSFVRQWNETGGTYISEIQEWSGDWFDGDTTGDQTNWFGCCWMSVTLEKGKDYVIGVPSVIGRYLMVTPKVSTTLSKFSQVTSDGTLYYYIRAKDWASVDPESVGFHLNYVGGRGAVGQTFSFLYRNVSIDDVLPKQPGMATCPIGLDVTASGSAVIADSVEKNFSRYTTAYVISLKANEQYTFTTTSPSSNWGLCFMMKDVSDWGKIPGKFSNVGNVFVVTVTEDYEMTFLISAQYGDFEEMSDRNPGGGTIAWRLGDDPTPQPTYAGTFEGVLTDVETGERAVSCSVVVKMLDNGQTNFTATVKDGSDVISLYDDGTGCAVTGRTVIAGRTWDQLLAISCDGANQLSVDGALYLQHDSQAKEYFFQGTLGGSQVAWNDCFMKYDPQVSSALEMGITTGAFAGEPAGSETLLKVHAWGSSKNVAISTVNLATFSVNGDPATLTAEAYLLNCAATDEAVAAAAAEFVIESYDPLTGQITMRGGAVGGDGYGNGTVQIRTSKTPGGTYDATDKGETSMLFSKAYLVK